MSQVQAVDAAALAGPATSLERLQVIKDVLILPFVIFIGFFRPENKARSFPRAVYDITLRYTAHRGWNIRQWFFFLGVRNSTEVYDAWARKNNMENLTDELEGEGGAKMHWVGPRSYERVLIYCHGGAFSLPANQDQHLGFLSAVKRELEKAGKPAGVVFLPYSLAPFAPFPAQLRQLNAAVTHLLAKGTSPSNIILIGDSAGGNLTLQFLSHTLHPFPGIPAPPTLPTPLAGALLISPWVTFGFDYPSFKENDTLDNINQGTLEYLVDLVTPGIHPGQEQWFEPVKSDEAWWARLDGKVRRVMTTVGEVECLRDPIEEFAMTRLKPNVKDFSWLVEKNGVHIDFLCDFQVKEGGRSEPYWRVISWLTDTFQG